MGDRPRRVACSAQTECANLRDTQESNLSRQQCCVWCIVFSMFSHTGTAPRTILFMAADPTDASRLRLGQEIRDIESTLRAARLRENFAFESRTSVRPADITQAIFDTRPTVVHFSGHGTRDGELCFESHDGRVQPVSQDALAELFKLLGAEVDCVVLNACFSERQSQAIAKHIRHVIGMRTAIGDTAAIAFATGFYKALAGGRSIPESFDFGVVELKLLGIPEDLTPVLLTRPGEESLKTQNTRSGRPYKHYVYVSRTKVNLIYSQLSLRLVADLAKATDIDEDFLLAGSKAQDDMRTSLARLTVVTEYIETQLDVGTATDPKSFVKDMLPMKWGRYASGGLVYFGSTSGNTVIGLGGSEHHVIGNIGGSFAHSHSATSAIVNALLTDLEPEDEDRLQVTRYPFSRDDEEELCYAGVQLATSQMDGVAEPIEFMAKTLKHWRNVSGTWLWPEQAKCDVLLGTPIYAAIR